MKRTTIFLDEAVEQDLRGIASRRAVPVASVVREALLEYVTSRKGEIARLPGFVAIGRSGRHDVAARHEEILAAELAPARRKRGASRKRALR